MITNILVKGKHELNVNEKRKIKVGGQILEIDKDIPMVRYRFEDYTDEDIDYIKRVSAELNKPVHMVEIKLNEKTEDIFAKIKAIGNIAVSIRIDVDNQDVESGIIKNVEILTKLEADRYVLVDKSDTLDMVHFNKIADYIKNATGIKRDSIGICNSPLAFDELSCLPAVKAREIMAKYSTTGDVALPTAGHQTEDGCCGCIRHLVVACDLVKVGEAKGKKEKVDNDTPKEKKEKKVVVKPTIKLGAFSL